MKLLVNKKGRDGKRLVQALEGAGVHVTAAFWYFGSGVEGWRLALHFAEIDELVSLRAYLFVQRVMLSIHPSLSFGLDAIMLQSSESRLIAGVRAAVHTAPDSLEDILLAPRQVGEFWLEGAHVYRMT